MKPAGQGRGEERGGVASGAGHGFGGEAAAAYGAFHRGRPPVAAQSPARKRPLPRPPRGGAVQTRHHGEGGASFLQDPTFQQRGPADFRKEARKSSNADARTPHASADLREGGADDEFQVAAVWPPAGSSRRMRDLVEHPLDTCVQQRGVVELGHVPVKPQMDGGDGRVG